MGSHILTIGQKSGQVVKKKKEIKKKNVL